MAQEERSREMPHSVILEGREKLTISGVTDVHSFDEEQVLLETVRGMLVVRGQGLHVERLQLEAGELIIQGEIGLLEYDDSVQPRRQPVSADIRRVSGHARCLRTASRSRSCCKACCSVSGIGAVYDMLRGTASAFPVRMGRGGAARYAVLGDRAGGLIRVWADRGRRSAARLCTLNGGRRHGIVLCGAERNCAGGDYAASAGACKAETRRIRPADALSNGGKTAVQSGKNSGF